LIFEIVPKPGAASQLTGRSVSLRARGSACQRGSRRVRCPACRPLA